MNIKAEVFIYRSESVTDTMLDWLMPTLQGAVEDSVRHNDGEVAEKYHIYVDFFEGNVKVLVRPEGDVAGYADPDSEFKHEDPVYFTAEGQA